MMGARLMSDKERAQAQLSEGLLTDLDFDSVYSSMETLAREDFEGRPAWKLHLVLKDAGVEQDAWYDVETGRQLGLRMEAQSPMGSVPITVVLQDYKEFSGISVPTRVVQNMTAMGMGLEQTMTIDSVTVNPADVPSFEPPAEVKALIERAAATPAAPGGQ